MTEEPNGSRKDAPSPELSFEERLKRVRARREEREAAARRKTSAAMGIGFRLSLELVVAVVVGSLIGFGLDRYLGTSPWLLVLFFMVGAAAGIKNMLRAVKELSERGAETSTSDDGNKGQDDDDSSKGR